MPQDRSGQVRKISPPPGFDPRTVQPVASRCTDNATRPTKGEALCPKHMSRSSPLQTPAMLQPTGSTGTLNAVYYALSVHPTQLYGLLRVGIKHTSHFFAKHAL